jgi:tRNA pseudouridine38-40 synthase
MEYQYKLTLAYDGTNYCGWQVQINGVTIQQKLMEAGRRFLNEGFTVTGSSRTDSGVHALGYVAVLCCDRPFNDYRLASAFNAHLPDDIVVFKVEPVDESFHPRYSAKYKTYRYTIFNGDYPIPQYMKYAFYYRKTLDVPRMKEAASYLVGQHDFVSFCAKKSTVEDTVRQIYQLEISQEHHLIHLDVTGNGFLYNMIRIIAGTLIEVGLGRIKPEQIPVILDGKNRDLAGKTSPAKGLTLVEVGYDEFGG